MTFVYFISMVGVLVFVHELGHFLWARVFGVRVLTFSLGFGPRIAGFRRAGTEYVLSAPVQPLSLFNISARNPSCIPANEVTIVSNSASFGSAA